MGRSVNIESQSRVLTLNELGAKHKIATYASRAIMVDDKSRNITVNDGAAKRVISTPGRTINIISIGQFNSGDTLISGVTPTQWSTQEW